MTYCEECLAKQQKINELEEEISTLKSKLRYQERTAKEGFFGSSTSSSKLPVKPNSSTGHQRNQGGGKVGHQGHGRANSGGGITQTCQKRKEMLLEMAMKRTKLARLSAQMRKRPVKIA